MIIICEGQGLVKRLNRFFYSRALGWMKKKAVQIKWSNSRKFKPEVVIKFKKSLRIN